MKLSELKVGGRVSLVDAEGQRLLGTVVEVFTRVSGRALVQLDSKSGALLVRYESLRAE